MTDPDWKLKAACRKRPELFFAGKGGGTPYAEARTLCGKCPGRSECLEMTMQAEGDAGRNYRYGMFAGLTPDERWQLYRCRAGKCQHEDCSDRPTGKEPTNAG